MIVKFFAKSDITFGVGAIKELASLLKSLKGQKTMVIYGSGVAAAGIAEQVTKQLDEKGLSYVVFDRVLANPSNELVEEAAQIARVEQVDQFVAVGGGSCIDLAKAVNILMTNSSPIEQYGGIGKVRKDVLPLVAIPTTAGTSSEITNVVALIDTKKVCKYVIIDNKITADYIIVDPELTKTMPPSVTAATGMDAITHAVESYISNMASPLTEYHSLQGLALLRENLPKVMKDGLDMVAREQMMLGCVIAGFGFSNANLGLVHGIAHTLSAHFQLAHGMANAAVLPYVIEYNAKSCPEKMVKMAEFLHLPLTGVQEVDALALAKDLKELIATIGIKTLSEQGILEQDLERLAEETLKEPVLHFNPRQNISIEDVLEILKAAF